MNETRKTLIFAGVAIALLLLAFATSPGTRTPDEFFDLGEEFFPEFEDPNSATTLEVVEYEEDTGAARPFKVTFEKGIWTGIELVTTLVGVGNVLKFRHLLKKAASQAIELKLAIGTVEVASGSLGTMVNFVNDCDPNAEKNKKGKKTFCQNLKDFLILLDIATLSVDSVDSLLRIQARRTQEAGLDLLKRTKEADKQLQINKIIDELDEIALGKKVNLVEKSGIFKYGSP